jgi:membrane protein implicated in regulation of membrane protease activity
MALLHEPQVVARDRLSGGPVEGRELWVRALALLLIGCVFCVIVADVFVLDVIVSLPSGIVSIYIYLWRYVKDRLHLQANHFIGRSQEILDQIGKHQTFFDRRRTRVLVLDDVSDINEPPQHKRADNPKA